VVWLNSEQVEKLEKVKEQGLLIVRKKGEQNSINICLSSK
jgi:hypothetical protein